MGTPGHTPIEGTGPYASIGKLRDQRLQDAYLPLLHGDSLITIIGESHLIQGVSSIECETISATAVGVDSGEDVCDDVTVSMHFSA